jgi:ribonuclease VapC
VIIETSAVLAMLFHEADAPQYAQVIAMAEVCRMSAANDLEAALNVDHRGDREASRQLNVCIERAQIHIEAVTNTASSCTFLDNED